VAVRAALELIEPGMRLGLGSGRAVWAAAEALGTSRARPELALDGADEVMRDLAVLKGGGGALLREKLVIACARRCVIVAEARKLVARLGERWRLPVEVVRFGWEGTRARLLAVLDDAECRGDDKGAPFVTDEGHHILDCAIPPGADLGALAAAVKAITGVVEHGLFLEHADTVLLGAPDGSLERLVRP